MLTLILIINIIVSKIMTLWLILIQILPEATRCIWTSIFCHKQLIQEKQHSLHHNITKSGTRLTGKHKLIWGLDNLSVRLPRGWRHHANCPGSAVHHKALQHRSTYRSQHLIPTKTQPSPLETLLLDSIMTAKYKPIMFFSLSKHLLYF